MQEIIVVFKVVFACLSLASLAIAPVENTAVKAPFPTVCYGNLGCFYTGPPFYDPPRRPISLPPIDPILADTRFYLFTPGQKKTAYNLKLTEDSISKSSFNSQLPLKILIFGWLGVFTGTDDISLIKDALLDRGQYNVIIVDWYHSDHGPYPQATANTRLIGAQVSQLIKFLQESRNISVSQIHIIGHSLGAQIAGYVGKRIKNIQRITGLDPAGPYFTGTASVVHLEASDAEFVDVIHTNMGGDLMQAAGTKDVVGDIDFYPNGGYLQPRCHPQGIFSKQETLPGEICDHFTSLKYFYASIRSDCKFVATQCTSYDDYEKGACASNLKTVMGFDATKIPGLKAGSKFYLDTSGTYPYCLR